MYLGVLSRTKPVIYYLRSQDLSHVLGSPRFCLLLCKWLHHPLTAVFRGCKDVIDLSDLEDCNA